MLNIFPAPSLQEAGLINDTSVYSLVSDGLVNKYYVVSNPGTRRLMISPEVVGYDSYLSMVDATADTLQYLCGDGLSGGVEILTILRGGLNYPLEECCFKAGIQVNNMNFVSCERVFNGKVITGLDIKYEKLRVVSDCTLMIGDIFATGDTLKLCLKQVVDRFHSRGGSMRRIVFFTVGGTRAIPVLESMTEYIRTVWPSFEGFRCVFYEGMFKVYEDSGCTGVNVPDVDFGWDTIAPEFREAVLKAGDALYEKCIIYDGGARRYEIPSHYNEVVDYWEDLNHAAMQGADLKEFTDEKLGYATPLDFDAWLSAVHYENLDPSSVRPLYELETAFIAASEGRSLSDIASRRLREFKDNMKHYSK